MTEQATQCGYVAIVGRPNVGKSTLLNRILGQKIAITSRKPQTTRVNLLGIHTENNVQAVFVDTPGLHTKAKRELNRQLNRNASSALLDVDVIVFVVEGTRWHDDDELVLAKLQDVNCPVILAVNKVDNVKDKDALLPTIDELTAKYRFATVVPVSALQGTNVDELVSEVSKRLPENPFFFSEDQITDKSERFLAAEVVREKLFRQMGQELPYATAVQIEQYLIEDNLIRISAVIWVEKDSQKSMVIGKGGHRLKKIGQQARLDLERELEHKVFLQLWVKVKRSWGDNERMLRELGYSDK